MACVGSGIGLEGDGMEDVDDEGSRDGGIGMEEGVVVPGLGIDNEDEGRSGCTSYCCLCFGISPLQ